MSDRDDFWDISALVPPKTKTRPSPFVSRVSTVPVEVPAVAPSADAADTPPRDTEKNRLHFIEPLGAQAEQVAEYIPTDNPLLVGVRISKRTGGYNFYHRFREDAIPLLARQGSPCACVPYFSYIPQYAQLSAAQTEFYLYFRDEANRGRYIQTEQSYVFLYIYEILNLPDHIPPRIGAERLAGLWEAYRKIFPQINKYMVQWLMDYCLLHQVACPYERLGSFIHEYLEHATLREFYLATEGDIAECRLEAILELTSDYQYKNGRYATGEQGQLFLTHIPAAAKVVLRTLLEERKQTGSGEVVNARFEAFCGALYAAREKYDLDVLYYSVSANEPLRCLITAIVKYAENKVRAHLSIKSRLSVGAIPEKYVAMLDAYFAENLKKNTASPQSRPGYEALYDVEIADLSAKDAEEIENNSWQNTMILVSEDELGDEEADAEPLPPTAREEACEGNCLALSEADLSALALALYSDRMPSLDAVERINEAFFDQIGDVIFDIDGDEPVLVEDYKTEVREALCSRGYYESK